MPPPDHFRLTAAAARSSRRFRPAGQALRRHTFQRFPQRADTFSDDDTSLSGRFVGSTPSLSVVSSAERGYAFNNTDGATVKFTPEGTPSTA